MRRFKIGQQVVCVIDHSQGIVRRGQVYKILDYPNECGCKTVDVGIEAEERTDMLTCGGCEEWYIDKGRHYIAEHLFAPLEADSSSKELTCDIEQVVENLELEEIEVK